MSSDHPTMPPEPGLASEIKAGWRIALPACLAFIPLGLALGVLVVQAGLAWWWAPIFGAFIYAGSLEFLLVGMVSSLVPLSQIALTAFLVNFRHVFYALAFPLNRVYRKRFKLISTFTLTDEAFALTLPAQREHWSQTRIIAIQLFMYIVWVVAVGAGALLGSFIPTWVVGLDFAVSALFMAMAIDAYKTRPSTPIPLAAIACALGAGFFTPNSYLFSAITVFVIGLAATYFWQRRTQTNPQTKAVSHGN